MVSNYFIKDQVIICGIKKKKTLQSIKGNICRYLGRNFLTSMCKEWDYPTYNAVWILYFRGMSVLMYNVNERTRGERRQSPGSGSCSSTLGFQFFIMCVSHRFSNLSEGQDREALQSPAPPLKQLWYTCSGRAGLNTCCCCCCCTPVWLDTGAGGRVYNTHTQRTHTRTHTHISNILIIKY